MKVVGAEQLDGYLTVRAASQNALLFGVLASGCELLANQRRTVMKLWLCVMQLVRFEPTNN